MNVGPDWTASEWLLQGGAKVHSQDQKKWLKELLTIFQQTFWIDPRFYKSMLLHHRHGLHGGHKACQKNKTVQLSLH